MLNLHFIDQKYMVSAVEFSKFSKLVSNIVDLDLSNEVIINVPYESYGIMNKFNEFISGIGYTLLSGIKSSISNNVVSSDLLESALYLQIDYIIDKYCDQNHLIPHAYKGSNELVLERLLMSMISNIRPAMHYRSGSVFKVLKLEVSEELGEALLRIIDNPYYEITDQELNVICETPSRNIYMGTLYWKFELGVVATLKLIAIGAMGPHKLTNRLGGTLVYPATYYVQSIAIIDCSDIDMRPFMKSFNDLINNWHGNNYILDTSVEYPYTSYETFARPRILNIGAFANQITKLTISIHSEPNFAEWPNLKTIIVEHRVDDWGYPYEFIIISPNTIRNPLNFTGSRYMVSWDPELKVVSRNKEDQINDTGPYHEHKIKKVGDWAVFGIWNSDVVGYCPESYIEAWRSP